MTTFNDLGLSSQTLKALEAKGFENPTEIQALAIPAFMKADKDIVGQAQTGTGKTAAFGLPIIDKLKPKKHVQAIILTPTRELANQVAEELNSLKGSKKLSIYAVYGGASITDQFRRLKSGVDIIVGTPGRVLDHLNRRSLKLDMVSHLVLDEADEMLNMGFIEEVEEILKSVNEDRRVLLFSATMPDRIMNMAKRYMGDYEVLKVAKKQLTTNLTRQIYYEVKRDDKLEALCRIIDVQEEFYGVVFCRTRQDVNDLTQSLIDRGYAAEGLHGEISQNQRELILKKFKKMQINIMIATDVAARGIDVNNLTHVVNYALPDNPETYVHRIGRTGRAGKSGTAITLVTPRETRSLEFIQKVAKTKIKKVALPKIKDVIQSKKNILLENIQSIIENENLESYSNLSEDLLSRVDQTLLLPALLKFTFSGQFDEENYAQIDENPKPTRSKGSRGDGASTRLFIAMGKKDKLTPKKLMDLLGKKSNVPQKNFKQISIMDDFSFATVGNIDADLIVNYFKKNKQGNQKPLVEKAKR